MPSAEDVAAAMQAEVGMGDRKALELARAIEAGKVPGLAIEAPAALQVEPKPLPCPFCGGIDLEPNEWHLDDETVPAWECSTCQGSAPAKTWNWRRTPTT